MDAAPVSRREGNCPSTAAAHSTQGLSQSFPGGCVDGRDLVSQETDGTLVAVIRRATFAALLGVVALGGCNRDESPSSDAERFCGEARANAALITEQLPVDLAELEATLDFYRLMGQLAPLAIATEWNTVVAAYETASTVVPGDAQSEQKMAMTIYAAEPSAYAVKVWLERNCGVDIPIVTIAPHDPVPARTLPPATAPDTGTPP